MQYWDLETGWTDCEGSFEEKLATLREDGPVEIIVDTGPQDHRILVGTCCGKMFILSLIRRFPYQD